MRSRLLVMIALSLLCGRLRAADYPQALTVTLTSPSRPWLNLEDCQAPAEVDLGISWRLPANVYPWVGECKADVFLAVDESCAVSVEIGKKKDEGVDATISEGQTAGNFPLQGDRLTLADVTGLDCNSNSERDYYFCIRWEYEETLIATNRYIYRGGAKLRFDVKRPGAPLLEKVSPGEENLKLQWAPPGDDDIDSYIIYYQREGSDEVRSKTETNGKANSYQLTGLSNYTSYQVWIAAVDRAQNRGEESNRLTGTPEPIDDFYEYYKGSGGSEDGGFCFVATAACGSYQDGMVRPLRDFRDAVLGQTAAGRELISEYYRHGPRWARAIRGYEFHRAVARATLAPAAILAEARGSLGTMETLLLLGAMLIAPVLVFRLRGRRRSPARRAALPLAVLLATMISLGSADARAQEKPADFQLQIRLGPYYPQVDEEEGLKGKPFRTVFGGGSELLFELGLDYEIWHGFGTLVAGGSFGFVQYLGKGRTAADEKSTDTTVFNLIPLRLSLGYHFDAPLRRLSIPLVPYVTAGISYYVWWILDGVGDISEWETDDGDSRHARGGIFGFHLNAGIKLLLDFFDQHAAKSLYEDVGVLNTYLFVEYAMSFVDGFGGDHFNVGDQTFMFGLMMEF